jgi:hypothetical protein
MKVVIANFGLENVLWPVCRDRATVATYEDEDLRPFWLAGDRAGYVAHCIATKKTAAGITPPKATASRWFNLATIVSTTDGDLWLHREKDELWWTISLAGEVQVSLESGLPPNPGQRAYVLHKPSSGWSNRDKKGVALRWNALHPRAKEFLFTEGTLQQLSAEHAAYAAALIEGASLDAWHAREDWQAKAERARKGAATTFDARRKSVVRMAMTAMGTAANARGQTVERTVKVKDWRFLSQQDCEAYLEALLKSQDGLCALTGLRLQFDTASDDDEMLCSLDRIDSNGHYEPGNLQVVCRFANRWKNNSDDAAFRRLVRLLRDEAG